MKFILFLMMTFFACIIYCQQAEQISYDPIELNETFTNAIHSLIEPSTVSGTKYFDYHSGIKKPFLFNGNFNIPYLISSEKLILGKKKQFFQMIQFLPEIKIRIFQNDSAYNDKSKPVRTPSYIPKISYFFTHQKFWNEKRKLNLFAGLSALHHSNGQDGWEFDNQDSLVNIYNGSFSESLYFQFLIGGKNKFKSKDVNKKVSSLTTESTNIKQDTNNKFRQLSWKGGFEWHPSYFSNQKLLQTGLYGGNRAFVTILLQKIKLFHTDKSKTSTLNETNRWMLNFEYITDLSYYSGNNKHREIIPLINPIKRLNIQITYYKKLLRSTNFSYFAQVGYFGSDNYNIYFQQSGFIARTGFAFGYFN